MKRQPTHREATLPSISALPHRQATAPQLRVATSRLFNSTWEDGDQIGLFAVRHNGSGGALQSSGNYIHNVKLTCSSANGGSWNAETPLWFPSSDVLDFYAYYPYNASAIDFNVSADQRAETGGKPNYNLSDLLTAKSAGVAKTASPVALTFSHALAMVQVSIPSDRKGFGPGGNLHAVTACHADTYGSHPCGDVYNG